MPVTVRPSSHLADPIRANLDDDKEKEEKGENEEEDEEEEDEVFATSATQILEEADGSYQGKHRGELLRSSFGKTEDELVQHAEEMIHAHKNGLIGAAVAAYAHHHHLVIRPEDIWIVITTQLRCYMNAHSEEVPHLIVPHEGQEPLEVMVTNSEDAFNVPLIVQRFGDLMDKHVL